MVSRLFNFNGMKETYLLSYGCCDNAVGKSSRNAIVLLTLKIKRTTGVEK